MFCNSLAWSGLRLVSAVDLEEKSSRFIGYLVPWIAFECKLAALREKPRKASHPGTAQRVIAAAELVPRLRIPKRTVSSSFEDMSSLEQCITAAGLIVVSRKHTDTGVTIVVEGPQDTVDSIIARAAAGR